MIRSGVRETAQYWHKRIITMIRNVLLITVPIISLLHEK